MLRIKIPQNLPSEISIRSSLPAQYLKNWHSKTLKNLLCPEKRHWKAETDGTAACFLVTTTFISIIPSKFCKVTHRHGVSGGKSQHSWNCVVWMLQHDRQQLYMPAQQEKNSIAFNRQAFSATSIIWSDIFPCLIM